MMILLGIVIGNQNMIASTADCNAIKETALSSEELAWSDFELDVALGTTCNFIYKNII